MKLSLITSVMLFAISVGLFTACDESRKSERTMPQGVRLSDEDWSVLLQRHLIFAHQSVGDNILAGVRTLSKQAGVNLQVTESRTSAAIPGITHFKVGRNADPLSKIKDFTAVMEKGAALGADIALMKLCYIDFDNRTDGKKLAEEYSSGLDRLSLQFPEVTFIAVTTPLTTVQSGPRAWVKRLLGRSPSGYAENAHRQEFNNYLRAHYRQQGRLFDLANIEAGQTGIYQFQGRPVEMLDPALTYDGGHLNANGEQYVAAKFLKFIAGTRLHRKE